MSTATDRGTDVGEFEGQVVLVSGAARGQGAEHARAFYANGASVVLADVMDDEGASLAAHLGPRATYLHLDVTDPHQWESAVAQTQDRFGVVSVLVNNAGIVLRDHVLSVDPAQFMRVLDVNLVGTLNGMQAVIPGMRERGGGAMINISSMGGLHGRPGSGGYGPSKWGVRGLSASAALDLAADSVRVNVVLPGLIDTPMVVTPERTAQDAYQRNADHFLIRRLGQPRDITNIVLFLASDAASYITGGEFVVDGGWTA